MKNLPIQIVDENDNPIGSEDMLIAHEKGLIHRVVRIMVEDDEGNILLQKRSSKMKRWPNCWDNSAGGHVDEGEDYELAAKRELREEIGIIRKDLTELGTYFTDKALENMFRLRRFNRVCKTKVINSEVIIDGDEVVAIKWFKLTEIKDLIQNHPHAVTDGLKDVMKLYYE